jgi:hypothetical protein
MSATRRRYVFNFSSDTSPLCKSINTFIEYTIMQQQQNRVWFTMVTSFGLYSGHYLEFKKKLYNYLHTKMGRGLYNRLNLIMGRCSVQYKQIFEAACPLYFIIIFLFLSTKYLFHTPYNILNKCYQVLY